MITEALEHHTVMVKNSEIEFSEKINEKLKEGWVLHGNAMMGGSSMSYFIQPMVRIKKKTYVKED